jgi:hypothetical protein
MSSPRFNRFQTLMRLAEQENIDPLDLGLDVVPPPQSTLPQAAPTPPVQNATPVPSTPPPAQKPAPTPPPVPIGPQPANPPAPQAVYQPGVRDRAITVPFLLWAYDTRDNGGSKPVLNPITKKETVPKTWYKDENLFDTIQDPEKRKRLREYNSNIRKEVEKLFGTWKKSYFSSVQVKTSTLQKLLTSNVLPQNEVSRVQEFLTNLKGGGRKRNKKLTHRVQVLNQMNGISKNFLSPSEYSMISNILNYIFYTEKDNGKPSKALNVEMLLELCLNRLSTENVDSVAKTIYKSIIFAILRKWKKADQIVLSSPPVTTVIPDVYTMDNLPRPQKFAPDAISNVEVRCKNIATNIRKAYKEGKLVKDANTKLFFTYGVKILPKVFAAFKKAAEANEPFTASQYLSDILTIHSILTFFGLFNVIQK